ncbi:hypothetical protein Scinn_57520 [Streptomyces virginiae]|uniref:Uncharacterized protein n=1 Tax=Streptomyces virginiae TaxID=1961 RepID=A0ABQ3NU47_STRVG|nr:hypothetical protein Scinn_57520 [Streptomyces virginiae]
MTARAASWIRSTALRRAISPGSSYSSRNCAASRTAPAFKASNVRPPGGLLPVTPRTLPA